MKQLSIITILTISIFVHGTINAQDRNMGKHPDECRMNLSTYTEFFNQGNITDAYKAWRWCIEYCPASTRNLYIHGVDIIEFFIEEAEDEETRQTYIDTLLMIYDMRIEYFGQEVMVLGRKANALLTHRPTELVEVYKILKKAYKIGGSETPFATLGTYKNVAVVLYSNNLLESEDIVNLYTEITDILNYQIKNADDETSADRIKAVKERVEELFVNSGAADCHTIIRLFTPQFKKDPKNVELAEKIIMLLNRGDSDECQLDDLYLKAAEVLYKDEKTVRAAHALAQSYFKRNEPRQAEKFYKEAIEMAEESELKADLHFELGLLYFSQLEQYPIARNHARSAISHNPNHGRAHMLVGRIYAAGGRDCGETVVERKALWWVVVDQFERAKRVDPSIAEEADRLINRYTRNFPTQEEGFWEDVHKGETFTVKCWINETTRVRFIN